MSTPFPESKHRTACVFSPCGVLLFLVRLEYIGRGEHKMNHALKKAQKQERKRKMNRYLPEGCYITTPENQELIGSAEGLERALSQGLIAEAPAVLCDHTFGLHVALGGGIRGLIPREEAQTVVGTEQIKDIAILTRVGKPVCFKVIGFKEEGGERTAILSRRAAQEECLLNYTDTLCPGDILPARITHLENFGAFVDIGCGIISLLSIDSISVSRIAHPSERLSVGEEIYCVMKCRDPKGRIYVSQRELLGSWEENAANFSQGQTAYGIVRSVESYGIFVELAPNLAGLAEYRADIRKGQSAAVYIKSILPEKMKIKLIIIDAATTPTYRTPTRYFIDPKSMEHIDRWIYSPPGAKRRIETVFDSAE